MVWNNRDFSESIMNCSQSISNNKGIFLRASLVIKPFIQALTFSEQRIVQRQLAIARRQLWMRSHLPREIFGVMWVCYRSSHSSFTPANDTRSMLVAVVVWKTVIWRKRQSWHNFMFPIFRSFTEPKRNGNFQFLHDTKICAWSATKM